MFLHVDRVLPLQEQLGHPNPINVLSMEIHIHSIAQAHAIRVARSHFGAYATTTAASGAGIACCACSTGVNGCPRKLPILRQDKLWRWRALRSHLQYNFRDPHRRLAGGTNTGAAGVSSHPMFLSKHTH